MPKTATDSSNSEEEEEEEEDEKFWIDWFLSLKGNEFFCQVDNEFITDRFNLTNLATYVPYFTHALNLILGQMDDEVEANARIEIERAARNLYGLIHARFIITSRGMERMMEKYQKGDFGKCPRVYCNGQHLLPLGLSDVPYQLSVKSYCPRCEDVYSPRSVRYKYVDGAFFGATFPHMFLQVYPQLIPEKSTDRYIPRIFGFKIKQIGQVCEDPPTPPTGNTQV